MSSFDNTNANNINSAIGDANNFFKSMTSIGGSVLGGNDSSPTLHRYLEFIQNTNSTVPLVDVGCICNSEYSNFAFETTQYWDSDSFQVNVQNAHKMISDLEWAEQSAMHNGTIQMVSGMTVISKNPDGYIEGDTSYFRDTNSVEGITPTNFNTFQIPSGGNGSAIDIFGYFHPDITDYWEFAIPASTRSNNIYTYLWVGDTAIYDYTKDNADINPDTSQNNNQAIARFLLNRDDFVPIRIQIISKSTSFATSQMKPFAVKPPSTSEIYKTTQSITENPTNGWQYFVSFTKNGLPYYKNLLYFGLVQSDKNANKYNCIFVPTTETNRTNMILYKDKEKLQYVKVKVPTPSTFSGKNTVKAIDGSSINLVFPAIMKINVTRAKYCVDNQPDPYTFYITEQKEVTEKKTYSYYYYYIYSARK